MGRKIQKVLAVTLLVALGSIASAQAVRMTVQQVWSGLGSSRSNPYYANIENSGPHDDGRLTMSGTANQDNIEYLVELPTGARKRVMFRSGMYGESVVHLRLNSSVKEVPIRENYAPEDTRYGLISDNPSDLIFLKGKSEQKNDGMGGGIGVGGCVPDDAPDRGFGYDCLDAVFLGDGTEKLREDQIRAIRQYVQSGGTVIFVGGAAQSASADKRWWDILPISESNVVTNRGLTERVGTPRSGTTKVTVAKGSCFVRGFGLGSVVILSVNPFESPVRESENRHSIVSKAIRMSHGNSVRKLLLTQIGKSQDDDYLRYSSSSSYSAVPMSSSARGVRGLSSTLDPYQIKPPSIETILWILITYVIVVVPINFLVLRKLNRLEVAWISTPLISVIFSMVLLNTTIGLYKANATTRTSSIAVLAEGDADSMVFGRSEMFFPRAKSTDLELSNIESILTTDRYQYGDSGGINLIDTGRDIQAPGVQTGNLAFKELAYIQSTKELKGLRISLVKKNGEPAVRIENQSHSVISGIILFGPGDQKGISESVAIGASLVIPASKTMRSKVNPNADNSTTGWQSLAASTTNKLIVMASVDSMHVGPKYGQGHPASQYGLVCVPQWSPTP
ncbi:MAG: hypothetical protein WCG75_00570 [Armatimonadota bacterium]